MSDSAVGRVQKQAGRGRPPRGVITDADGVRRHADGSVYVPGKTKNAVRDTARMGHALKAGAQWRQASAAAPAPAQLPHPRLLSEASHRMSKSESAVPPMPPCSQSWQSKVRDAVERPVLGKARAEPKAEGRAGSDEAQGRAGSDENEGRRLEAFAILEEAMQMGLFDPRLYPEEAGSSADSASHVLVSESQLKKIARDVKGMKGLGPMTAVGICGFTRAPFTTKPGDTFVIELPNGRLVTQEHPENVAPGGEVPFRIEHAWWKVQPAQKTQHVEPSKDEMAWARGDAREDAELALAMECSLMDT